MDTPKGMYFNPELVCEVIADLQRLASKTAVEHGFRDEDRPLAVDIALMHSELSEALEQLRDGRPPHYHKRIVRASTVGEEEFPFAVSIDKPEGWAVELADCIIRILETATHHKVDLGPIVLEKMAFNDTRPYKHGKAF